MKCARCIILVQVLASLVLVGSATAGGDITQDFLVTLPKQKRPLPEPLPAGKQPGFKYRGIKTWMWTPEQCLAEIPVLARYQMNFFMNCYTSMCDVEHFAWGDPNVNRWWEDLPADKKQAYEKVVTSCREHGLIFCFSMNPNICTKRILKYDSPADLDLFWKHYAWMQGLGVKWFNIQCDDITQGVDATGQARFANEFLRRLRAGDPDAQLIFCPTIYWGAGTDPKERAYLEELDATLNKDVIITWTGDGVVGSITRAAAESYTRVLKRRLWVCDNYPVNDNTPTLHLAPVTGRDPDLCAVVEGYYSNSMCPQNETNRVPLLTIADYAFNPAGYDPARSIGQAIMHLADTAEQRQGLKDLVEAYPGMLLYKSGTSFNAVRHQFNRLASAPHCRYIVRGYIRQMEDLSARLARCFPNQFADARKTLDDDIAWMKAAFSAKYGGDSEDGTAFPAGSVYPGARKDLPGRQVKVSAIAIGFGGDHDKKLKLALEHLETASDLGVDIACLPEEFAGMTAEPISGPTTLAIAEQARKHHIYVICPIREQAEEGTQYNTAVLIDRQGKVAGYYRKVFVFWGEGLNVSEEGVKVFDTDFGRISILTCFDANFAEFWQEADQLGAEIVFWPSAYGGGMPLNGYAMCHNYCIVPVGRGNIIDATGRVVESVEKPRPDQFVTTLDLDRTLVHKDFTGEKVARLLKEHKGEVEMKDFDLEGWYLLWSVKPGVRVRELCRQYDIEILRDYRYRSRAQINQARKEKGKI